MQSLEDQIKNLLNPNDKISVITEGILTSYKPIMPVSLMVEVIRDSPNEVQTKLLSLLNEPGIVIFGGVIYIKTGSVEIKDRIARIFTAYTEKIESIIGEKKALIEIYSKLKPHQIIHLIQQNIVFVLRNIRSQKKKGIVAVKYIPDYNVEYKKKTYRFPPLMLGIYISPDLRFDRPEVIYDGVYDHMFVYRDYGHVGQRICLGTLESDDAFKTNVSKREFSISLAFWMAQGEQILRYGYSEDRSFTPVYRIEDPKFQSLIVKK